MRAVGKSSTAREGWLAIARLVVSCHKEPNAAYCRLLSMPDHGLNLFQRLARRWDSVHPYNAAQVMRVADAVDPNKAGQAWAEALRALGLGRVYVADDLKFRHEALNGEFVRYPLAVLGNGACVAGHLTRELNRPFDQEDEPPFRPFVLNGNDGTYLGVVYQ